MAVTALTPTDPTTDPTAVPKPVPATKPVAATPTAPLTNPVPNTPAAPTATAPKPMIDPAPPMVSAPAAAPVASGVSPLPTGYTQDPTSGVVSYANAGGAGAAPLTAPLAQKYWDNASQSYKDSTIKPTQTQAQSDALTAGTTGESYQGSIPDQLAAWQASMAGKQAIPTYDAQGNLTGTQIYAGGTASGPGLADIQAQNLVNSAPSPQSLQATGSQVASPIGSPAAPVTGPSATGVTTANSPISTLLPNGPATSGPYANTQQIVPGGATDLTSQLITPGQGTDRLQLANQYEQAWNDATNPQFAADQRDALRSAAAGGALGSGQLNTNLGSLTANRDLQRNAAMQNFLTNAQEGSIEDAFRKLGILQQQQGFQAGQQNTAFNQGLLQNEVGNMNNPDTLLAELAAQYNQQAGQAAGSVGQLAQASSANQNGQIPAWLLPLLQGYGNTVATVPAANTNIVDTLLNNTKLPGVSQTPGGR